MFGLSFIDPRSSIVADAAGVPNTTAPPDDRIFRSPLDKGTTGGGSVRAYLMLLDGTSLDVDVWVKIAHRPVSGDGETWVQIGTTVSLTSPVASAVDVPPNAEMFLQTSAPVGSPTLFGVAFG